MGSQLPVKRGCLHTAYWGGAALDSPGSWPMMGVLKNSDWPGPWDMLGTILTTERCPGAWRQIHVLHEIVYELVSTVKWCWNFTMIPVLKLVQVSPLCCSKPKRNIVQAFLCKTRAVYVTEFNSRSLVGVVLNVFLKLVKLWKSSTIQS